MPMYNLLEYSDNYQDSSATLNQYKRDEPLEYDAVADLTADNSSSLKYKISLLGNPVVANNIARINVKVVVPLKYLSNFFRSLEMLKYEISLLGNPVVANNIARINVKVVVPLKYLSNFFRSLEMPLINCN